MLKPLNSWEATSDAIHREFVSRAPNPWRIYGVEDERFLTLALAGEVGELANFIKKRWRGDDIDPQKIRSEIADIRIYLELLSRCFNFDLDQECLIKNVEVIGRLNAQR